MMMLGTIYFFVRSLSCCLDEFRWMKGIVSSCCRKSCLLYRAVTCVILLCVRDYFRIHVFRDLV
jgi:hypothetical protein